MYVHPRNSIHLVGLDLPGPASMETTYEPYQCPSFYDSNIHPGFINIELKCVHKSAKEMRH